MNLIVLKIGGSAISNKNIPFSFRKDVVEHIAKELTEIHKEYNIILVHGGGSYGHPIAKAYDLSKGLYAPKKQLLGFSRTRYYMSKLNLLIIEEFIKYNLPVITIQTSSVITAKQGKIYNFYIEPIIKLLSLRMIPVMYGDVVIDEKKGIAIISGDDISTYLAIKLKADKLLFGLDVDGIYSKDPSLEDSELIEILDISSFTIKGTMTKYDVTGGIFHKIEKAIEATKHGINVYFFNITKQGRLLDVINEKGTFTKLITG